MELYKLMTTNMQIILDKEDFKDYLFKDMFKTIDFQNIKTIIIERNDYNYWGNNEKNDKIITTSDIYLGKLEDDKIKSLFKDKNLLINFKNYSELYEYFKINIKGISNTILSCSLSNNDLEDITIKNNIMLILINNIVYYLLENKNIIKSETIKIIITTNSYLVGGICFGKYYFEN